MTRLYWREERTGEAQGNGERDGQGGGGRADSGSNQYDGDWSGRMVGCGKGAVRGGRDIWRAGTSAEGKGEMQDDWSMGNAGWKEAGGQGKKV